MSNIFVEVLRNIPYDELKYCGEQKAVYKKDIEHLMYRELNKTLSQWDKTKQDIIENLEARGYKII